MEDDLDSAITECSAEASDAPHVNVVFFGPCGCGKSTTAGRLIADTGAIDKQSLERIALEAEAQGKPDQRLAWILDKLQCERERGGTMYVALWRCASRRCRYTFIDAPGHNDFTKDTVTAMSQADIGVLVVSADRTDNDGEGQILEHTLLAYTLGLRQLVVCVNKRDAEAVGYMEEDFHRACDIVRVDLDHVGLKTHDVHFDMHFVPISALPGDNVAWRSGNTPWYCGPTLLEALDDAVASDFKPERPLRLPIREVMEIGGTGVVAVGRVATGTLQPGMTLLFAPGNIVAEVGNVKKHHQMVHEAVSGDTVNISLDVAKKEVRSGMVACAADDHPACECSSFLAQVIVLSPPRAGEIAAGSMLWVECAAVQVQCLFETLVLSTDRRTGQVLEMSPAALRAGDAAVVRLRPQSPVCVERFSDYPPLGRFAVRDQKTTVAVGVVQEVERVIGPMASLAAKRPKPKKDHRLHSTQKVKKELLHHHRAAPLRPGIEEDVHNAPRKSAPADDSGDEWQNSMKDFAAAHLESARAFQQASEVLEGYGPAAKGNGLPISSAAGSFVSPPFAAFGAVTKRTSAPQQHPPCIKKKTKENLDGVISSPARLRFPAGRKALVQEGDTCSDG